MHLFIDWLEYENFMGGTLRVEFGKSTDIFGANGTGKSRFKDAYSWLITGRNAENEAKFPIKDTLNPERNILPHRVAAGFSRRPGGPISFEKSYIETWSNVQGEAEKQMTGNKIVYKIDGNVTTATEYKRLMDTLIPENLLKMLSDPLYFPDKMAWEDQRSVLALMAHEVTNEYVLDRITKPGKKFDAIVNILDAKQSMETRKGRIDYEIKELRKLHTPIQPKIEENTLQITNLGTVKVKAINAEIERLNLEIDELDKAINSKVEAEDQQNEGNRTKRNTLNALKNRQQDIETEHTAAYNADVRGRIVGKNTLEDQITDIRTQVRSKEALLTSLHKKKTELDTQQTGIETRWKEENAKDFPVWDDKNFICDKCNRKHETDNVEAKKEELENHFIENKRKILQGLNSEWEVVSNDKKYNATLTETTTTALEKLKTDLTQAEEKLTQVKQDIEKQEAITLVSQRLAIDAEYQGNIEKISTITEELAQAQPIDYGKLRTDKAELNAKVDLQKKELHKVETIASLKKRNEELSAQEKQLAQQIADFQKESLLIDEFEIAKSNIIEEKVRSKFKEVTFKMFKTNIGDTIPKPACELWYQGKPWKALNTGSKLNAGLDVINALSAHYGIFPPLLIDNRESTTNIIDVEAQIINFFVSAEDLSLRIVNNF